MTPAVKTVPDDDELPELAPLDTDEGVVEVPDEIRPDAWTTASSGTTSSRASTLAQSRC